MTAHSPAPMPGLPSVLFERDVPCVMRDGVTLATDIYRPASGGPFPVILIRLPYDKTQAENISYAHPSWYARHGYIVVSQDCRGRYASEGDWYPFKHEADDGFDAIEWAAKLPGSNGKVGMYGFSYGGATQLLPAVKRPPSLITICPAMTGSQYYDGWTYNNGAFALAFAASWALSLGIADAKRRHDHAATAAYATAFANSMSWHWYQPVNEHAALKTGDTGYFFDWLAHPTYDDYWRQWSIDEDYSRITTPALHLAGWYDIFLSGTVRNYQGLRDGAGTPEARAAQKLLIGPWFHIPWRPLVSDPSDNAAPTVADDWQLAWFDRFLKDTRNSVLDSPVTVFVLGENKWRDLADWPPPGVIPTGFYLHSGGRANSRFGDGSLSTTPPAAEPPDIFTYDPGIPVQGKGGHSCCFDFVAPMGPVDQFSTEQLNGVLVYTSDPLADDLLLLGDVSVVLHAASSAVDTDWTARFCTVDPSGTSINIQEGIVRARYRNGFTAPAPIEPNRVYEYEFVLGPVGIRIPAGHRIRLAISSSDFPQWERNMNTGGETGVEGPADAIIATQIVLHDAEHPSRLVLPVASSS